MQSNLSKTSSLILWFDRPFPSLETVGEKFFRALIISSIVFLSMFLMRPFNLNATYSNPVIPISLYTLLTFAVVFSTDLLLPRIFKRAFSAREWSIGHHLSHSMLQIVLTAFCNAVLYKLMNDSGSEFRSVFDIALFTFIIAIIPLVVVSFFTEKRLFKKMSENAAQVTEGIIHKERSDSPLVHLTLEKEKYPVRCDNILYASAEGNYVQLFIAEKSSEGESVKALTMRTPLKELLALFDCYEAIVQCHRSYFVNLGRVELVTGNARGYTLKMPLVPEGVAVSRSKAKMILDKLAEVSS